MTITKDTLLLLINRLKQSNDQVQLTEHVLERSQRDNTYMNDTLQTLRKKHKKKIYTRFLSTQHISKKTYTKTFTIKYLVWVVK